MSCHIIYQVNLVKVVGKISLTNECYFMVRTCIILWKFLIKVFLYLLNYCVLFNLLTIELFNMTRVIVWI